MTAHYWPTPRQHLWLEAALRDGDAARDAWRRVAVASEPQPCDDASESLLPLAYLNLARLGVRDEGLAALREQYVLTWSENQRFFHGVRPLFEAFERAGIDAIALKGLALIARFYRDAGVRPMADVDVLVRAADVERAGEVAARLGWLPRYRLTPAFLRVKHAAPFDHPTGVACDLHWRVFEEAGGGQADDALRAAAETVEFQGTRLRVLSPTDQLLHVCAHAARWSPEPSIRWVSDAAVILREGRIDWERLVAHAARRRFVLRMREMLGYLRQALGCPVPPSAEADLARRPVSMLERLEHRVRGREHRVLGELPVYVFNCFRGEARPLLALPGYLRDAWGLDSLADVPRHALGLAAARLRGAAASPRTHAEAPPAEPGAER